MRTRSNSTDARGIAFLIAAALPLVCLSGEAEKPDSDGAVGSAALRVKRLNEGHLRIVQERTRLMQRATELQRSFQELQRDVQTLRAGKALGIVQSAVAEINRDIQLQQAQDAASSDKSQPVANAILRSSTWSATANENRRLAINFQLQQLDKVSRLAIERLLKVIGQHAETRAAIESTQIELEKLQSGYWAVTDAQGRQTRDELLAMLDAMVPLPEDSAAAFVARGYARRSVGRLADAERDFDAAIALGGHYAPIAVAAKGEFLVANGKSTDGFRELRRALRLAKSDARVTWIHAQALAADGRWNAAEAAWRQVLQTGGYDSVAHRGLALLYGAPPPDRPAAPAKALVHARLACDVTLNEDWTCIHALAAAHAANGEFVEAATQSRRAAELTSGDKRDLCLEHAVKFESNLQLVWNWK